jgi:hypothetical protein
MAVSGNRAVGGKTYGGYHEDHRLTAAKTLCKAVSMVLLQRKLCPDGPIAKAGQKLRKTIPKERKKLRSIPSHSRVPKDLSIVCRRHLLGNIQT